jgi:hypothetical protein
MRTMMPLFAVVLAGATLGMAGCPNPGPNPPGPTDAAVNDTSPPPTPTADSAPTPTVVMDATPPPSTDPCAQACAQMSTFGCAQQTDCANVLSLTQANRIIRNPKTKQGLTCTDLLGAKTPADVQAMGWNCGGASKH